MSTIVFGVGNEWRGDDGAGLVVARRIRDLGSADVTVVEVEGDCSGLVGAWTDADEVIVIDAVSSGAAPGTIQRFAGAIPREAPRLRSSTHGFGVADAVELGRSLGRLPRVLRVYGIEGREFGVGRELSPEVRDAAHQLADELVAGLLV